MAGNTTAATGKRALSFVLLTVLINSVGFGIMLPVLPTLIKELTGLGNSDAAIHGGWLTFVFAAMQFVAMPIVGALSDAYGRRKVMLLSLFGLSIDYFLMGFAPTIAFLYLGRVIAGAFGATYSTANAYVADVSPPETRAQNFGLIGAAFGLGFIIGPAVGGVLGEIGPRVPFFAAGVLGLVNCIYGYLFLPETLVPEKRRPFSWKRANPFGAFKSLGRVSGVKGFIFILFLLAIAHTAYPSTYTFVMLEGLDWSEGDVGWSLAAFGLCQAVVQGGLIRVIVPKLGLFKAAALGILSAAFAYAAFGVADEGWMVYAAGPFAALAGLYGPTLTNMASARLPDTEQGELQGAIGAAQGLALMIGPLAMTGIFSRFTSEGSSTYAPGAPFLLASLLAALALLALWAVSERRDRALAGDALDATEAG